MADPVLATKIAVLVLFFVATMMCGLLPMLLVRLARSWTERFETGRGSKLLSSLRKHGDLVVSCIMCLGAGVLLATIFTHMIPEVREVFVEIEEAGLFPDTGLPPGELFLCAGFFLVYFIEEMVHTFLAHGHRKKRRRTAADAAESGEKQTVTEESSEGSEESEHDHRGHDHVADIVSQHAFRAYLVVIALSVHSVFEGFAAAFEDSAREVWVFFAAIMAHKAIVAFCIGEQLLNTKRSVCFIVSSLSILSLATPLGVLLGLVVASPSQQGGASLLATGILQGLAAGTILYVIFFELLGPEQQKPGPGLVKLFAMLFGFALMLVIHSTGGHSHSHGGHSHAVGAHGHGAHGNHAMHHGHDHGHHADHIDDVAASVEGAIRAHDHDHDHHEGHSDHSDHHDHSAHAGHSQENGHKDQHDHDHDHDHDHGDDHGHDQGHDHDHGHDLGHDHGHDHDHDHDQGHDHDHGAHPNHVTPSKPGKSSDHSRHDDHDQHGHSDHHDHATHADHTDHPESVKPAVDVPGVNSATYEIFGAKGEAEGDVVIRQVPKGNPSPSANGTRVEDEEHHFQDDGHDHLAPETRGNAVHGGESGRDHSDHAGHDHSDHAGHDHSDHTGHDHSDHAGHDHSDHAGHDHSDHAGHDHSDHASHDHSDHTGHDHSGHEGHDHSDHAGHDHSDHASHDHSDHAGHDHSDHAGHDHSDPEHGHASDKAHGQSKQAGDADKKDGTEKHSDHSGHDHSDHAGHDHSDHAGHDHSDHAGHDHSDHAGHDHSDHAGHDHSDHAGHDHSDHSNQPPRDGAGRGMRTPHGHPDHAHEHKATAETPSLETGTEMTANSGNSRMTDASRNSAARPAADHEHSHPVREGHKLSIEGSGSPDQPGFTEEEPVVTHELSEISSVVTDPKQ